MSKTKSKNIVFMLLIALLIFNTTSFAAEYDWIGEIDNNWDVPGNWAVTGSIYTWPNEQYDLIYKPRVNDDCEEINIAKGGVVNRVGSLDINGAADGSNEVALTIKGNSELNIHPGWGKDIWIANGGDSKGRVEVRGGSHLELLDGAIRIGNGSASVGTLSVVDSTVDIAQWLIVGRTTTGIAEFKSSTLNITGWDDWSSLYIAYKSNSTGSLSIKDSNINIESNLNVGNENDSIGSVEIKDSSLNIGNNLLLNRKGALTTLNIKGSSIINIGNQFRMNIKGAAKISNVVMSDGDVTVGSDSRLNMDGGVGSVADFILKDGIWFTGGNIFVGETADGDSYLRIKDGTMISNKTIYVGNPFGSDNGESKIYLNGGMLQGDNLEFNEEIGDSLIIYRGGELWINNSNVTETDMQNFIDIGKIDVPTDYEITTIGAYTVLRS